MHGGEPKAPDIFAPQKLDELFVIFEQAGCVERMAIPAKRDNVSGRR
jgi:hypothetical protein